MSAVTTPVTTVKTYLRPIDRDGLMAFAEKGRNNPASRGTNKVHTVVDGQYRTLSYVGKHAPVVVDEPPHLFGQDTAPAPGEIVLSALGGCLAVGITAVATWKQVRLSKLVQVDAENALAGRFEQQLKALAPGRAALGGRRRGRSYGGERVQPPGGVQGHGGSRAKRMPVAELLACPIANYGRTAELSAGSHVALMWLSGARHTSSAALG